MWFSCGINMKQNSQSMIKSVLRCDFCTGNHFSVLQILPTAQRLLDELLSSQENAMNTVCGAPGMLTLNKLPNILYVQFILVSWNSGSECTFFIYMYCIFIMPCILNPITWECSYNFKTFHEFYCKICKSSIF